mmetsp:Transcript_92674/g.145453  ORF Transcript_92674/g.145453 Transcript_92674/m.145453 type:complete len:391 (-) Transcript_92674:41-1213(-)
MNRNIVQLAPAVVVPPPSISIQSEADEQLVEYDVVDRPRPFAAARELLAQNGQKRRHRKRHNPTAIPNARLEHLMCFIDNSRLQDDIQTMKEVFDEQASDLMDINWVRGEEVLRLSSESQALKRQMQEPDDAVQGCHGYQKCIERSVASSRREHCEMMQQVVDNRREQVRDLQRQLESQSIELARTKERTREVQREAAKEEARLEILQTMHRQEMQELRKHLFIEDAVGSVEQRCEALGSGPGRPPVLRPSHIDDPTVRRLQLESARSLIDIERRLHREEVDALTRDFRETSAIIAAAVSSSASLYGLDFDTDCDHSRCCEDEVLLSSARWRAAGRHELRRCCEELQRPMNLLLSALEQEPLPKVPPSIADLDLWLQALSARLTWAGEIA